MTDEQSTCKDACCRDDCYNLDCARWLIHNCLATTADAEAYAWAAAAFAVVAAVICHCRSGHHLQKLAVH